FPPLALLTTCLNISYLTVLKICPLFQWAPIIQCPVPPSGPKNNHVSNPTKPARRCSHKIADCSTSAPSESPVQACISVFHASLPQVAELLANSESDPLPPVLCTDAISNPSCSPLAASMVANQLIPPCTLYVDGA